MRWNNIEPVLTYPSLLWPLDAMRRPAMNYQGSALSFAVYSRSDRFACRICAQWLYEGVRRLYAESIEGVKRRVELFWSSIKHEKSLRHRRIYSIWHISGLQPHLRPYKHVLSNRVIPEKSNGWAALHPPGSISSWTLRPSCLKFKLRFGQFPNLDECSARVSSLSNYQLVLLKKKRETTKPQLFFVVVVFFVFLKWNCDLNISKYNV